MKKEDFCDKYILREGDFLPEKIKNHIGRIRLYSEDFFKHLQDKGLVFDNLEEATERYRCIMGSMKKQADEKIIGMQRQFERLKAIAANNPIRYSESEEDTFKIMKEQFEESYINNYFLKENIEEVCKPRIYISGPISGHDMEERRKAFKEIREHLEAQGYEAINPMENGLPDEADIHDHMRRDIELLMTCDYIYLMKRWTHSKGCMVELEVATSIGLPVMFEEASEITKFE